MKIVVSALFAMACTFPDKSNDNNNNDEQNLSCDKIWHENKLLREEVDRLRAQLGISPKDDTPHQHGDETPEQSKRRCATKIGANC